MKRERGHPPTRNYTLPAARNGLFDLHLFSARSPSCVHAAKLQRRIKAGPVLFQTNGLKAIYNVIVIVRSAGALNLLVEKREKSVAASK